MTGLNLTDFGGFSVGYLLKLVGISRVFSHFSESRVLHLKLVGSLHREHWYSLLKDSLFHSLIETCRLASFFLVWRALALSREFLSFANLRADLCESFQSLALWLKSDFLLPNTCSRKSLNLAKLGRVPSSWSKFSGTVVDWQGSLKQLSLDCWGKESRIPPLQAIIDQSAFCQSTIS